MNGKTIRDPHTNIEFAVRLDLSFLGNAIHFFCESHTSTEDTKIFVALVKTLNHRITESRVFAAALIPQSQQTS